MCSNIDACVSALGYSEDQRAVDDDADTDAADEQTDRQTKFSAAAADRLRSRIGDTTLYQQQRSQGRCDVAQSTYVCVMADDRPHCVIYLPEVPTNT